MSSVIRTFTTPGASGAACPGASVSGFDTDYPYDRWVPDEAFTSTLPQPLRRAVAWEFVAQTSSTTLVELTWPVFPCQHPNYAGEFRAYEFTRAFPDANGIGLYTAACVYKTSGGVAATLRLDSPADASFVDLALPAASDWASFHATGAYATIATTHTARLLAKVNAPGTVYFRSAWIERA